MISMSPSSYGYMQEVAKHRKSVRDAQVDSYSSFSSA